jgi:hypothetical protein
VCKELYGALKVLQIDHSLRERQLTAVIERGRLDKAETEQELRELDGRHAG